MQHADSLWWVILLCGAGTFLLRLLPMRWMQRSQQGGQTLPPRLMGALQALGPAAIGALLVAALWPQWSWGEPLWQVARLLLAISALAEPGGFAALGEASWVGWGGAVYSAVFASLLGHGLFFRLVQRHPVAQVTPYLLLTPVFAVLLGIVFWGDRPGPALWIGGAMVLGGVLMIAVRRLQKARPPVAPVTPEV